jgi:hypothetical protein
MPLYKVINALKTNAMSANADIQKFVDTYPAEIQAQLIRAINLGRAHRLDNDFSLKRENAPAHTNIPLNKKCTTLIDGLSRNILIKYINELLLCASNSNFDLNKL